jgi:mannitol operon repressor
MLQKEVEFDPMKDLQGFLQEFQNESSRAAVILGASFLDAQLRQILANFMIDPENAVDELLGDEDIHERPLSTFSARIKAAYCLGLISKNERDDLNLIRRIRNRFAHRLHDLTFDDKKIIGWCNSLKAPSMLPSALPTHRERFVVSIALLLGSLRTRAGNAEQERRTVAREFKVEHYLSVGDS